MKYITIYYNDQCSLNLNNYPYIMIYIVNFIIIVNKILKYLKLSYIGYLIFNGKNKIMNNICKKIKNYLIKLQKIKKIPSNCLFLFSL